MMTMTHTIPELKTDDFDRQVLQSDLPVVVDFFADWCGPCKMLEPVISQLAQDWSGKVKVVKLDVDDNSNLAMPTGTVTVNDNDTAGLIINYSGQLITSESGATQSLSIQLKTQPVNTVTIELTSLNTGEGIIFDPYTWLLTFNASNWNQPQQVSIMGVSLKNIKIFFPVIW